MTVRAGVVADKISVNTQAGYSGEGPNENAVALLGDNKTVICIMRRDSAVSARAHAMACSVEQFSQFKIQSTWFQ